MSHNQSKPSPAHWKPQVASAITIDHYQQLPWLAEADLIVAGFGGAGATAAVQALEGGLSVIALDRFEGGGSTAMNGGIYYAGGGTHIQQEAGVEDSVQAMFDYLKMETQGVVKDSTLMRFCQESVPTLNWLEKHGVAFRATLYTKKTSYPPLDYYLYHSDSSMSGAYAAKVKPAARGHKVFSDYRSKSALGFGKDLYEPLRDSALRMGLQLYRHFEVSRLVQNRDGRVIGVEGFYYPDDAPHATQHHRWVRLSNRLLTLLPPHFPGGQFMQRLGLWAKGKAQGYEMQHRQTVYIKAKHGVCLSTGGFVYNREWVNQVAPAYSKAMPLGNPGDDGAGVKLGVSVGAQTDRMNHLSAWRFINPPSAFAKGMLINHQGKRIVDETNYGAALGLAMSQAGDRPAWIILDKALLKAAKHQINNDGLLPFQRDPARLALMFTMIKADTLEALAQRLGVPFNTLMDTMTHYHAVAQGKAECPFGKNSSDCFVYGQGPFYALDVSVQNRLMPLPSITLGGLTVDEDSGAVLDEQQQPIHGLYAAGRTAVGVCSHLYVSGLAAADCVFSGRRAAQSALALANQSPLERLTQAA